MPIETGLPRSQRGPKTMPVLPNEIVEMIFQALELSISVEEEIDTVWPQWHAAATSHESFYAERSRFIKMLNRHWALISLISRFWHCAVNERRLNYPTILKSSSPAPSPVQVSPKTRRITKISAQIDGDHTFSEIVNLGRDALESITLRQGLAKGTTSPQAWRSLSQVPHLRELTINQSLSTPLPLISNLLDYCHNLEALQIFSFGAGSSPQPEPLIDKLQSKEPMNIKLTCLTCHISIPCYQFQLCDALKNIFKRGRLSLKMLTLVFEDMRPNENHLEDEEEDEDVANLMTEHLCEAFRECQNLQTLRIATPNETLNVPFMDRNIALFPALEHLHLKGSSYSPELFTTNLLPRTLKTLDCQAYSRPISTLVRAIRNSLSHQLNLESLIITTYRRKPRSFREAIYGELDLPHETEEMTMGELLLWDQCQTETIIEQKLLIQECQARAIKLDGPRPFGTRQTLFGKKTS